MVDRVSRSIRTTFEQCCRFLMALLHAQKDRSSPDPAAQKRARAAKTVRDAMHSTKSNSGFSPFGASEKVLGKELADGHKESR